MPLARMMLSMSQRCSSKRRTCGSPRLSKTACGGLITFIAFLPVPVATRPPARSLRLATNAVEDRHPAHAFILKESRRLFRPDIEHRLKAEPDELGLEGAIRHRLLGHRVETLEDRRRRARRSEDAERGLRH